MKVHIILRELPVAIRLEQSDNAIYINDMKEVQAVIDGLSHVYTLYSDIIETWRHGDVTNRKRYIIVGFLTGVVGEHAMEFAFPSGMYDEYKAPCALHISVPDDEVPYEYWRHQYIDQYMLPYKDPVQGKMHLIARTGNGMGYSKWPHAIYSWLGLLNTQVTTNGGGRRPPLDWWYQYSLA